MVIEGRGKCTRSDKKTRREMKGGRRLGGKINMSNSAVKKLLSTIRVITTKLRKAKTSAFQGGGGEGGEFYHS